MVIILLSFCCLGLLKSTYSGWKNARIYEAERDALQMQYDKLERRFQALSEAESLSKNTDNKRLIQVEELSQARVA